jgi:hypothetical protein
MALDRGGLAARTFLLPQQQSQQPIGPSQQQPFDDGIRALEGLQYVEGQTSDYFKKIQALKAFMQDAQTNLGIDVRVPDLSRPESIKLNQIFRNALSDIMAQGNLLKNSQSMYMMAQQRGDLFFKDPTQQAFATMRPQQDYSFRSLEPIVTEANDLMQQAHYAGAYDKAKAIYEEKKNYYEQKIASEPDKADYYRYQLEGLVPPREGVRVFNPNQNQSQEYIKWGRKVGQAGNWLKKITNLSAGAHESFTPDPLQLNPNGKPYLISKELVNSKVGDTTIKQWRLDPDTREVTLELNNGSTVVASVQDPASLTMQIGTVDDAALNEYITKNQYEDEYGQVKRDALLSPQAKKLVETKLTEVNKSAEELNKFKTDLSEKLGALTTTGDTSRKTIRTKTGKMITIERGWPSGKYYIKDFQKKFLPPADKNKSIAYKQYFSTFDYKKGTGATKEELIDFLINYTYYQGVNTPTPTQPQAPGTNPAPNTPAPTGGKTPAELAREFMEKRKQNQ